MSVETIMTSSVLTVGPQTTVGEAIRLIEDTEVRHLPVVEGRRLVGIISDRDLREYRTPGAGDVDTPVSEVMASEVISVDSSESVTSVLDAMIEYKVGAVPVVDRDSDELVGIVSYIDVLRYARELFDEDE